MKRFAVLLLSIGLLAGCSGALTPANPALTPAARHAHFSPFRVIQSFGGDTILPAGGVVVVNNLFYGIARTKTYGHVLYAVGDSQAPKAVYTFADGSKDGYKPNPDLVSVDGVVYGTTELGGVERCGVVFSYDPKTAQYKVVFDFKQRADGCAPSTGLTYQDGMLYGTTGAFGAHDKGTLFGVRRDGTGFKVIHQFGPRPDASQVKAPMTFFGGKLYGVSTAGGEFVGPGGSFRDGLGTAFAFALDGSGGVTNSFDGDDGFYPDLKLADINGYPWMVNATFKYPLGRIMALSPGGFRVVHTFSEAGYTPSSGLVVLGRAAYGVSQSRSKPGLIYEQAGPEFQVVFRFTEADGVDPGGTLLAHNNTVYGVATRGGKNGEGTFWAYAP